jgi:hypothetical protein
LASSPFPALFCDAGTSGRRVKNIKRHTVSGGASKQQRITAGRDRAILEFAFVVRQRLGFVVQRLGAAGT